MTILTKAPSAWLPQETYDRLSKELEHLCGPARQEIATRLEAARAEGNAEENGAYLTTLEEQAKNEGRILELKELLETAHVGENPADDGVVDVGMVVEATVGDQDLRFLFGNRQIAKDYDDLDVYSERSPLGVAIHGAQTGQTVTYTAPNGKAIEVTINAVTPYKP
ncbi:GreA/GreB family elongation factor [Enteractinococcus coprophilus]|uniref:Transcription elongation factor GreA n=1 Tax=Enteractinococcus coprophilus TaxID=1027633 RepID=A0A543ANL1_9MICC|nr:GreA/GreB family elongation factor [Enteractinococcus coprophilus]TQL74149.1 transcription elongation factor GreA [Enteractinococcus coprophilus]